MDSQITTVLADRAGMWFIPPHMVKEVVESGELSKARDYCIRENKETDQ